MVIRDRKEAGRLLAAKLETYRDDSRALILALPRGGVAVGYELSLALRLPLDVFVTKKLGLPDNPEDVSLAKAILAMAKGLDLKVVAEGVETQEQLSFLASQACDLVQGYLLAKPMNAQTYEGYLHSLRAAAEPLDLSAARHKRRVAGG